MLAFIPPAFCWISDNAGVIPTNCPSGYYRSLALCYEECASGYSNVAGVCWEDCRSGYTDWGAFCTECHGTSSPPFFSCDT